MAGIVLVLVFALLALYPTVLNMDGWSYLVIAAVSVMALAIGHIVGPADPHEKTALAIECGVRHPALALTIAGANFGAQRAMPVLVPCVLTFVAIALVYMAVRGRSLAAAR